ncbi:MAG: redoxin domain-containing protein [Bacteroidetes bacterium]|nr:redoxin domain-containing protein [Bacteroidota bacterium]
MTLKKIITFFLLLGAVMTVSVDAFSQREQTIPRMDFETFEPWLNQDNDTVYVINFWATWCKPCIKELPEFEKLNATYENKNVRVILVSLDFPNKHEERLLPFVADRNLKSRVFHLTDVDANKWIDKVSPEWSGALPATIIYKGDTREFHEASMTYEQLKSIVEPKR